MVDLLKRNWMRLGEETPSVKGKLPLINAETLELCQTKEGEDNLVDTQVEKTAPFYSSYSAKKEMETWAESLPLDRIDVLYVYGIGLGYAFHVLESWLTQSASHYLVFLEDDLRVLKVFMGMPLAEKLLEHPQVHIIHLDETSMDETLDELAYSFVQLQFEMSALPHYERTKATAYATVKSQLMRSSAHIGFVSFEFLGYGSTFFQNYYRNLPYITQSYRGSKLFGQFKNVPAIICGAGPSLNKNIDVLKQLEDRALIFGGGSAAKALSAHGIIPHFGCSVDPNPEQFHRMTTQDGFEVPFFYKGRINHNAFMSLHGPRLLLSGNSGYPVSEWIEQQLGLEDPVIQEGYNVLHFCMDLSRHLGCNPIIFVGMDLAYSGLCSYASGVIEKTKMTESELTAQTNLNDNAFQRKGVDGEMVYTLWKWVAEANYTAKYAKNHPEIQFINATEGGLGVEGVPNLPLAKVKDEYLTRQLDLRAWISSELATAQLSEVSPEKVFGVLQTIYDSLSASRKITKELSECFERIKKFFVTQDIPMIKREAGLLQELSAELGAEIAHEKILEPVNQIRSVVFEREFEEIERNGELATEFDKMVKRYENGRLEFQLLEQGAQVNLTALEIGVDRFKENGFDYDLRRGE